MDTLTTAAATGTSTTWKGGAGLAVAQGTFGSGSFTVEASFDAGSNWITLADETGTAVALTAEGTLTFALPPCSVRGLLSGSTAATVEFALLPIPA